MSTEPNDNVCIPLAVAAIIDRVFLPRNPNKMRGAASEVVVAAHAFRAALRAAPQSAKHSNTCENCGGELSPPTCSYCLHVQQPTKGAA